MKGMKINTKFYLEELQCDWETHSGETYSREQINSVLIAKRRSCRGKDRAQWHYGADSGTVRI
jgi:hypothetical protein